MEIRIPRLFVVIAVTASSCISTVCYINVQFVTKKSLSSVKPPILLET